MRFSLPLKTALLFFAITGVGVTLISLLGYDSAGKMLQIDALENLSSDLKREGSILEFALNTLKEDVRFLSKIPPVQGIVRATEMGGFDEQENTMIDVWKRRMAEIFQTVIHERPAYAQIRFIGMVEDGKEIVRVNQEKKAVTVIRQKNLQAKEHRNYFKAIAAMKPEGVYISGVNYNRENGKIVRPLLPTLRVGAPVMKKSGEIFGMVIINVNIGQFARSLYEISTDQFYFLANEDGEFLIHPDENKRLAFEFGRTARVQDEYDLSRKHYAEFGENSFTSLSVSKKRVGIALHRIHFDDSDQNRFLLLGSVADFARINEKSLSLGKNLTWLALGIFLFLGLISTIAVRWLTRPILSLKTASDRITAGEKGVEIKITSRDEVGDLAKSMSLMVEKQRKAQDELRELAGSLEIKVKERTVELESLNREMESFVYTISHDLKSPIVSLRGLTDLIVREIGTNPPGDIKTYLEHLQSSVTMMGQLTEDLLELSRVGRMDYKQENIEINDLVAQVVMEQSPVAKKKGVDIRVQPSLPPVMANKKRVYQIFSNLLGNAVKFMPDSADSAQVEIFAAPGKDGMIIFTVKDNGAGIDPKYHDRVFTMFQRLHGREIPGTGMGLALVKKIVENLGGSITLESSKGGGGASFHFTLPASKNFQGGGI